MKNRTKNFSINILKLCTPLNQDFRNNILAKQLIRSATSIGANYRAACRAKSKADFIYKIQIVEEEADESIYWLELLKEINPNYHSSIDMLLKEADELTAIFTAIGKTSKLNSKNQIK